MLHTGVPERYAVPAGNSRILASLIIEEHRTMSMVMIGCRLSAEEMAAELADPTAVDTLLYGDLDDDEAETPDPELDLDKSWHSIHYLLTGTAWQIGEVPARRCSAARRSVSTAAAV